MKRLRWLLVSSMMSVVGISVGAVASAGGTANPSETAIPSGFFKGEFVRSGDTARVFIKHAQTVSPRGTEEAIYGLVIRENEGAFLASLFRIEELEGGTQAWIQLVQSKNNVLVGQNDVTYTAHLEASDGKTVVRLSPTEFGKTTDCNEEIRVKKKNGYSWTRLPDAGIELEEEDTGSGLVSPQTFNGRFQLDGVSYQGQFNLREMIPGVSILRAQAVNMEAADGRQLEREINAVVITLKRNRPILTDYFELHMVRVAPGKEQCHFKDTQLEQD